MEREIQVISPGALGNAMQPGQCPPPPAVAFVQNGKLLGGECVEMGTDQLQACQLPPASPRGGKSSSPSLASVPMGSPSYGTSGSPVVPGWSSGSVGAVWLPSPSPSRKYLSGVYGDRAGSGTPSPGAGPGSPVNSVTLQQHRQRPVAAAPFADANLGILAGAV